MKRLLDYDPLTQQQTWFSDHNDGTFSITTEQDVEPVLEANKRSKAMLGTTKKQIKNGFWHYASIPGVLIAHWSKEIGGDILAKHNSKELFKRLNLPEYSHVKTTHGKHTPRNS
jgi:hypothetical protein